MIGNNYSKIIVFSLLVVCSSYLSSAQTNKAVVLKDIGHSFYQLSTFHEISFDIELLKRLKKGTSKTAYMTCEKVGSIRCYHNSTDETTKLSGIEIPPSCGLIQGLEIVKDRDRKKGYGSELFKLAIEHYRLRKSQSVIWQAQPYGEFPVDDKRVIFTRLPEDRRKEITQTLVKWYNKRGGKVFFEPDSGYPLMRYIFEKPSPKKDEGKKA